MISSAQYEFLARLPMLLNSSLDTRRVISLAMKNLSDKLECEAATVFLRTSNEKELIFWSLQGGDSARLEGKKISAEVGIVGWVNTKKQSLLVPDVAKDPRFFSAIDNEGGFKTKSIICVPLIVRGEKMLGALEVLNKKSKEPFTAEDLEFVEQFSHQAALAIDNAQLFQEAKTHALQLATLDRRKQEMISIIAHEFRTPLSIIQNAAEMLSFGTSTPQDKEILTRSLKNGITRLTSLVSRIREVSVVSGDKLDIDTQPVSVAPLLDDLVSYFQEPLQKRNLLMRLDVEQSIPDVLADNTLLLIVLRNLIANAIRFTEDGGQITLSAKRLAGRVEFSVSDTGIGISDEELPLIFEKFYEIGDSLHHCSGTYEFQSSGLGLGLSAVRAILEAHGSSIDVRSKPGKGSTFSFCINMPLPFKNPTP